MMKGVTMIRRTARPEMNDSLLSVKEAAAYLGLATGTLRNWLSARRVPFVKLGGATRISRAALDTLIADHTVPSHEAI
jgi:excisionase family DNA binding protein